MSEEDRADAIARAMRIIRSPNSPEIRVLGAIRCLIAADAVNARREATEASERSNEVSQATSVLRAALASGDARAALAALTEATCQGDPLGTTPADAQALPEPAHPSVPVDDSDP